MRRQSAIDMLREHYQAEVRLRTARIHLIKGAHDAGLSWAEIGEHLAMTGEGARIAYVRATRGGQD